MVSGSVSEGGGSCIRSYVLGASRFQDYIFICAGIVYVRIVRIVRIVYFAILLCYVSIDDLIYYL